MEQTTWGTSRIKADYVGRGLHMDFRFADEEISLPPYLTSEIKEVTEF